MKRKVKPKVKDKPTYTYTHKDSMGIRWRWVGSRLVSELADQVMADCKLPPLK